MDSSFFMPGEVETQGNTYLDAKSLPQCKLSICRHNAISEERKN